MDLSIIIVNYNSNTVLKQCLDSIYTHKHEISFETVVVDNASSDNSIEMIGEYFPQVKIIQNEKNMGFGTGCNQGIRAIRSDHVLLLNPDTIVEPYTLENMINFMKKNQDCGVLGPKIIDSEGSIQLSCRRFPLFKQALFNRYSLLTKLFPKNKLSNNYLMADWDHNEIREVDWVSGACMLVRRQALDQTGLFDENYFMYCEDVDLCYRMNKNGQKTYYLPNAKITHYIGQSSKSRSYRSIIEHHKSMFRFYKKYYSRNFLVDYLTLTAITLRAGLTLSVNLLRSSLK